MCGIIGYTGNQEALPRLLNGLSALEYRGYDSAGVAVQEQGELHCVKAAGRLENLQKQLDQTPLPSAHCGIGHTRWATHGDPSTPNAHPHGTDRVLLVHNGIIENYADLRIFLREKGYAFSSQTDTETAALLTDYYYARTGDPIAALEQTVQHVEGSYAFGALFADRPDEIYALRKDSPLLIALSDEGNFIASDLPAVLEYTDRFFRMEEGEIARITPDGVTVLKNGKPVQKTVQHAGFDRVAVQKGGYAHFMLKETFEEPEALRGTVRPRVRNGLPSLDAEGLSDERLRKTEAVRIIACGTAMHAGLVGAYALEHLCRVPVTVEIASEFRYRNPILQQNELALFLSQSGETADTLAALRLAKSMGIFTLAVVNAAGSSVAREADAVLYTYAGPEIAVASTKAYSTQIAVLYLLAFRTALVKGTLDEEAVRRCTALLQDEVPEAVRQILENTAQIRTAAEACKDAHHAFFIGRNTDWALAAEGALKLKEVSYIHAEAYAAGELKHGTISLITEGTPVIAVATQGALTEKTFSNMKETKARGAKVLLIAPKTLSVPPDTADEILQLPSLPDLFAPFAAATAVQLFAYYAAAALGRDVDKPRNLAKSVTVE